MTCPKCGSKNVVSHTDDELRKEHELFWQCWDCDNFWYTDWEAE